MQLVSNSFADGQKIPAHCAFGVPDQDRHVVWGHNRNPHLAWSGAPAGTRSLAVLCVDSDVPSKGGDANREGRTIARDLPRIDFFHWILIDLPPRIASIAEGEFSARVAERGKPGPAAPHGARQGLNDYTRYMAGNPEMSGDYFGYDGPCPPWNDLLAHRYVFTVYALDIERLPLEGRFFGDQVRAALQGHILAQASLTGVYTLNPAVSV
ncbi:MAG: YbhB/YbcL family Raf kinase inhibitor-like protein [Burkholderiaceae bacterium]|nr:YbhB/YbcL family Raf kinase inhibitor-like protein [Burkholderiaceae bacterium]